MSSRTLRSFVVLAAAAVTVTACGGATGSLPDGGAVSQPSGSSSVAPASNGTQLGDSSVSESSVPPFAMSTSTTAVPATTSTLRTVTLPTSTPDDAESASPTTAVGPSDPTEVGKLLARSLERLEQLPPSKTEGTFRLSGVPDAPGPVEMVFVVEQDPSTGDSAFSIDMSGLVFGDELDALGAAIGEMSVIQVGDTGYVRMAWFAELLGVETPWISMPADDIDQIGDDNTPFALDDPEALIRTLESGDAGIDDLGWDRVDGESMRHLQLLVDQSLLGESVKPSAAPGSSSSMTPIDVWIDSDDNMRQIEMTLDSTTIDAESVGAEFGTMVVSIQMDGHGESIDIVAPPADQVTAIDQLGGLPFGLGSGGLWGSGDL